jgi:LemA protein
VNSSNLLAWAVAAVLLFWTVGAYNRLVRLRGAIVQAFTTVDQQFRQRQELLQTLAAALTPLLATDPEAAGSIVALGAAIGQADSACSHARARPGAVGAITSLRMAEDIVAESRARLPAQALADPAVAEIHAQLLQVDSTLAFARRQFNEAVTGYNAAVRQFPTWVIAGLFSFRAAGTL